MISNQTTLSKMKELRLHCMAEAFWNILETDINEKFSSDELLVSLKIKRWELD